MDAVAHWRSLVPWVFAGELGCLYFTEAQKGVVPHTLADPTSVKCILLIYSLAV